MVLPLQKYLGLFTLSGIFAHQSYSTTQIYNGFTPDVISYLIVLLIFLVIIYQLESGNFVIRNKRTKRCAILLRIIFSFATFMIMRTEYQHSEINEPLLFGINLNMIFKGIMVLAPDLILKVIFGMQRKR